MTILTQSEIDDIQSRHDAKQAWIDKYADNTAYPLQNDRNALLLHISAVNKQLEEDDVELMKLLRCSHD